MLLVVVVVVASSNLIKSNKRRARKMSCQQRDWREQELYKKAGVVGTTTS